MIRLKIRQDFERNRAINDLGVINVMLLKNQQEYQETMNCWKQEVRSHREGDARMLTSALTAPYHGVVQAVRGPTTPSDLPREVFRWTGRSEAGILFLIDRWWMHGIQQPKPSNSW